MTHVRKHKIATNEWIINILSWNGFFARECGTEVEIQLPLKRFPDSSVSSLILVG